MSSSMSGSSSSGAPPSASSSGNSSMSSSGVGGAGSGGAGSGGGSSGSGVMGISGLDAAMIAAHTRTGEMLFLQTEKVNSELLTMTYGALVSQLCKDYKDIKVVNNELDKMGCNLGVRLIDEFLAKSNINACANFRETANVISKVAFKMFLGITADAVRWSEDGRQCSLVYRNNPLLDFVDVPPEFGALEYTRLIAGAIRGACNAINMHVDAVILREEGRNGSAESEIRLTLKEILQDMYNDDEDS